MSKIPENILPDDYAAIKQAAKAAGVRKSAMKTDLVEQFRRGAFTVDNVGTFLAQQKSVRPHWFKDANGAGGKKGADNPWSAEGWNVTRQGAAVRSMGIDRAQSLARSAGSHIGATKPPARAA